MNFQPASLACTIFQLNAGRSSTTVPFELINNQLSTWRSCSTARAVPLRLRHGRRSERYRSRRGERDRRKGAGAAQMGAWGRPRSRLASALRTRCKSATRSPVQSGVAVAPVRQLFGGAMGEKTDAGVIGFLKFSKARYVTTFDYAGHYRLRR